MKIISFDLGLRNLGICMMTVGEEDDAITINSWTVVDVITSSKYKNAKTVPIEGGTRLILDYLKEHCIDGFAPDLVAIESQPVGRHVRSNVRMKVLSHVIQSFFYLNHPGSAIKFVSPKKKNQLLPKAKSKQTKKRYEHHKRESSLLTEKMVLEGIYEDIEIRSEPNMIGWFQELEKKDDAADSWLQGFCIGKELIEKRRKKK